MKDQGQQTELIAAPKAQVKMVRIKTLRPINIPKETQNDKKEKMIVDNVIVEGTELEVTEAQAIEFCDRVYPAGHDFEGELTTASAERHKRTIKRAVRL